MTQDDLRRLQTSAWAELVQSELAERGSPTSEELAASIARSQVARDRCEEARTTVAAIRDSIVKNDGGPPKPRWLQEWIYCVDDLLAVADSICAALPSSESTPAR